MTAADAFVYVVQDGLEDGVVDPPAENLERLDQWHPRLQQGRELLVEHEELARGYPPPAREADMGQAKRPGALNCEDVQPFFFELPAKPRLVIGNVNAFDDVAARGAEPAAKLHDVIGTTRADGCNALNPWRL